MEEGETLTMLLGPILDGRPLLNEQFLGIIVQLDVEAIDVEQSLVVVRPRFQRRAAHRTLLGRLVGAAGAGGMLVDASHHVVVDEPAHVGSQAGHTGLHLIGEQDEEFSSQKFLGEF